MNEKHIQCISEGVYGVDITHVPLCYMCDQPMFKGESLTLQYIDAGPGHSDLVALVHTDCECDEEDWDDE